MFREGRERDRYRETEHTLPSAFNSTFNLPAKASEALKQVMKVNKSFNYSDFILRHKSL